MMIRTPPLWRPRHLASVLTVALGLGLVASSEAQVLAPPDAPRTHAIRAGRLIDPRDGSILRNQVVLVEEGVAGGLLEELPEDARCCPASWTPTCT